MLVKVRNFLASIAAALLLAACGGGGDDDFAPPVLEVRAVVNGRFTQNFAALPGTRQALVVPVGLSFELNSNRPVAWSVFIGGVFVPGQGNTYTFAGTSVQETVITNALYAARTFGFAPLTPFQITVVATSLENPDQATTVDVLVTK